MAINYQRVDRRAAIAVVTQRCGQLLELAIFRSACNHALAGAQLHDAARCHVRLDEVGSITVIHPQPAQQTCQCVTGTHSFLTGVGILLVFQMRNLLLQIWQRQILDNRMHWRVRGIRGSRCKTGGTQREGRQKQGTRSENTGLAGSTVKFIVAELGGVAT